MDKDMFDKLRASMESVAERPGQPTRIAFLSEGLEARRLASIAADGRVETYIDWNDIEQARELITMWADLNFPKRTPQGTFVKLLEEIAETAASPGSAHEYADLLILIFDLASMHKINIAQALREKMEINLGRKWTFNEATGLAHHIEENE